MEFASTEINEMMNSSSISDSSYKFIGGNNPCQIIQGLYLSKFNKKLFAGYAEFDSLKIFAKPNFTFNLIFSSNAIARYYNDLLNSNKFVFETEIDNGYYVIFQISTNPCQIGEIYRPELNRLFFFSLSLYLFY